MKILITILLLNISGLLIKAQTTAHLSISPPETNKNAVMDKITSGLYKISDTTEDHIMISGTTTHFSEMVFRFENLKQSEGEQPLRLDQEQILIIKEGEAKVTKRNETDTLGPNSVLFLLPGEEGTIISSTPSTKYYRMIYKAFNPLKPGKESQDISSFTINYDKLVFNESNKGGVRRYFNRSTAMCPYYEMHVTTLNPGIQSHPPHTHEAAEIILIIEGDTEEEIDGKTYRGQKGDLYFLASNVPHAIRNVGDKSCQYFAFQWGKKKQ